METDLPNRKIEAIYDLREAVEVKVRAEAELEKNATPAARDALLDAQLDVEAKTQDAIEICHQCGHALNDGHGHNAQHDRIGERSENVVQVDFRPRPGEDSA